MNKPFGRLKLAAGFPSVHRKRKQSKEMERRQGRRKGEIDGGYRDVSTCIWLWSTRVWAGRGWNEKEMLENNRAKGRDWITEKEIKH